MSPEDNRKLTQVGPGTPMGEVLRRHWHPVAAIADMERSATRAVRLLGEDLVLYRDLSGQYGLVQRRCAHRGADLANGYVEQDGIRCHYHGWQFNAQGQCIDRPFDRAADAAVAKPLAERVTIKGYPVRALAGLLWAYLGPLPAPELPDWEPFHWANGFVQVIFADVPCNWLQCQENSIDPVHFEWTHTNWSKRLAGEPGPYGPTHLKLGFDEFEHGFIYRRITEGRDENDPLWKVGRVCLWPNAFFLGEHFEWRVPVDDENTLSVTWSFIRVPKEAEPYRQQGIPAWRSPTHHPQTGEWINSHVINQDIVAWVGQGRIADRSQELLAGSDRGIVAVRKRLFADIEAVERGEDPKGVIRDPAKAGNIVLPNAGREMYTKGLPLAELRAHPWWGKLLFDYVWHYGQPAEVRSAYRQAMGLEQD